MLNILTMWFIPILFAFGIIIFIHELGHFLSARAVGMKVEKFAFGFGPEIIGRTVGETRYAICWVPLGGMVKLAGEMESESSGGPGDFFSKPWYQRVFVVAAGPLMNYLLAIVFFFAAIFFWGVGVPSEKAIVGEVKNGFPADRAGLRKGDLILAINKKPVKLWQDLAEIIHSQPGKKITIKINRDNEISDIQVIPEIDVNSKVGVIGIMPEVKIEKKGFVQSVKGSVIIPVNISILTLATIWEKIVKLEKLEVSGPIGIAVVVNQAARSGFESLLYIIGFISVMVGLMNLLPIPVFDGGHIMFFTIEGLITKKRMSIRIIELTNYIGLSVILSLMFYAFYSDFIRFDIINRTMELVINIFYRIKNVL
ncbi:MAG: RIP metalloprotease RseP [Elusimicrobia bacterium RIFOXYB2_FULL_48_7]|nr:MAG: RIP metalloprotease RseP [Elusimicrobia bacterium RIFOXYB2_FULL_48_7]